MTIQEILQKEVSFQPSTWLPISKTATIGEVLNEIKCGKYKEKIQFLRELLQNDKSNEYHIHKKTLPAVTFCASFDQFRRREFLREYNYIMVLDIDNLKFEAITSIKEAFSADEYVFSYWESPSQCGIKGLVFLTYYFNVDRTAIDKLHRNAFKKIAEYFLSKHQIILDESGSDTTRLCFLSSDPDLIIKDNFVPFTVSEKDIVSSTVSAGTRVFKTASAVISRDVLFNPKNKNLPINRKNVQSIIKYLRKRDLSITNSYEEWYKVALAIANSFTYDLGEKYFLSLCKMDKEKYEETSCKKLLTYCYHNSEQKIRFNTIEYYARNKGYKTNSQRSEVPKAAT